MLKSSRLGRFFFCEFWQNRHDSSTTFCHSSSDSCEKNPGENPVYVHQYSVITNHNPRIRTWIKCPMYSSTRKWCLCIVSSPHLGDKSINTEQTWKLTGDDFSPGYKQRLWCLMKRMPTSHQPVSRFGSSVKSRNTYKIGIYVYSGSIIKSFWLQAR